MKKNRCFIDFDGTLVDNKHRMYRFFVNNINEKYREILTENEFWKLKKMGINEIEWINKIYKDNLDINKWQVLKKKIIEKKEYLRYDKLFNYSIKSLNKLGLKYELILVTRRSNELNLYWELELLKIKDLFLNIEVVKHDYSYTKSEHLNSRYIIDKDDIFIGDTEDDIRSALNMNIKVYFVLSGIRDRWVLKKEFPEDWHNINIVDNIFEILC